MLETFKVRDWMTSPALSVTPETSLSDARDLMRDKAIRRLPVVDGKQKVVGIVTIGDIREASPSDASSLSVWEMNYLWDKLKVKKVMTKSPASIGADAPLLDVAQIMLDRKIGGVPVVEADGTLCGIITESDIFRMLVKSRIENESTETQ